MHDDGAGCLADLDRVAAIDASHAMREIGLDPARIPEARRDDIDSFVELHIEQGPILEAENRTIGVVMGGDSAAQRDRQMAALMDRGFAIAQLMQLSAWTPQYWTFWLGLFLVVLVMVGRDRFFKPWTWFRGGRGT